jgi:hypothetical protein
MPNFETGLVEQKRLPTRVRPAFHGILTPPQKGKSVTHVSGTICCLGVGSLNAHLRRAGLSRNQGGIYQLSWQRAVLAES